jgi:hypothetical protein
MVTPIVGDILPAVIFRRKREAEMGRYELIVDYCSGMRRLDRKSTTA